MRPQPVMGAEDFAFMLQKVPGAYIWMGMGGGEEGRYCHTPIYDFNDEALPIGASYWARLVERLLPRASAPAHHLKYRAGVTPSAARNAAMNALGLA